MDAEHPAAVEDPELDLDDPYRYGWRYVRKRRRRDGKIVVRQVPLTEEDVLHPKMGDFIMNNDPHWLDVAYLRECFEILRADDPSGYVLSDCRVDWQVEGIRPHGPDVAVFTDVRRKPGKGTFRVRRAGARPLLVVEVTSPATRKKDLNDKVEHYQRVGIPFYAIADATFPTEDDRRLRLFGYRLGPAGYERVEADDQGRLWLEAVGAWLIVNPEQRLRCVAAATGEVIPDRMEEHQARLASEREKTEAQREAQAARQRAGEAEERLAQQAAELEALRETLRRLRDETNGGLAHSD